MTLSKLLTTAVILLMAPIFAQAQIGDYEKSADISNSDQFEFQVVEDQPYGRAKTDYRRRNASGGTDRVTEKILDLDLFVPITPPSVGKRAVIIMIPGGGRSGCRGDEGEELSDGTRFHDPETGCDAETIVEGGVVEAEGQGFNHLNNARARTFAQHGIVVASLVTRYRYELGARSSIAGGTNTWFRTADGIDAGGSQQVLTNLSDHLELLVTDIKRSMRWLTANADDLNIDPNYIFIDGGSGGAKMVGLAAVTNETQLIVDDPANIDVAFEQEHNNWDIRNSTPGLKGVIMRAGDLNGVFHTNLMDTMSENTDSFMFWTGTEDFVIVSGLSAILEDKCEILGTCSTQFYSLPNVTHGGETGAARFPHPIETNDQNSPIHTIDFIVDAIYRDTLNQPTISISQDQTSFSESAGTAQITIERTGDTSPEIQVTVTADQMREVMLENGTGGPRTTDLITKFVAKASNSDGVVAYEDSSAFAYEDGSRIRGQERNRLNAGFLTHSGGKGNGQFILISDADDEYHGIDFIGRTQTITIPSGQTSVTFDVDIESDDLLEDNECFKVRLLNAYGANIGNSMEVITILDDDSANPETNAVCGNPEFVAPPPIDPPVTPTISITPLTNSVDEGDSLTLTINSDIAVGEDIVVQYRTQGINARSRDGDYQFRETTATIPAGSVSVDIEIETLQDTEFEGDEDFTVLLEDVTVGNALLGSDPVATITIIDDDSVVTPSISITPLTNSVDEGDSLTLTINSDVVVSEDIVVQYRTQGINARSRDGDYQFRETTATIPAGSVSVDIEIETLQDTEFEGDEDFAVLLEEVTVGNALLSSDPVATITIIDDDSATANISITALSDTVDEGASVTFRVNSDVTVSQDVSFEYRTIVGTGANIARSRDGDYQFVETTATIPAGSNSVDITIATNQDTLIESDETFGLRVNEVTAGNAILSSNTTAIVTIIDDDNATPNITVAALSDTVNEGASVTFRVSSDVTVSEDIGIEYRTIVGTGPNIARSRDGDYRFVESTAVIPAGSNSVDITIATNQDNLVEGEETFGLRLNEVNAGNALLDSNTSAIVTIIDDDAAIPTITITPAISSIAEGSNLSLTLRSDVVVSEDIAIEYQTQGVVARSANGDYQFRRTTAVISAGTNSSDILIETRQDTLVEGNEDFRVDLNEVVSGTAIINPNTSATITIIDDD